jgi:hypothetical protein
LLRFSLAERQAEEIAKTRSPPQLYIEMLPATRRWPQSPKFSA